MSNTAIFAFEMELELVTLLYKMLAADRESLEAAGEDRMAEDVRRLEKILLDGQLTFSRTPSTKLWSRTDQVLPRVVPTTLRSHPVHVAQTWHDVNDRVTLAQFDVMGDPCWVMQDGSRRRLSDFEVWKLFEEEV